MRFFTSVYILLLIYIVAALVFWGISLNKNAQIIFEQEKQLLKTQVDSANNPGLYASSMHEIVDKKQRRRSQYIGEGSTFFLVILIGAAVVYSSFRRSIRLSRQQNNFMLAVTHELKSPIAAVKLNLQTLEKHQLSEEQRATLLKRCISESNRLNDLCNNMLIASQMEGRQYVAAKENIDFTQLVNDSIKDYTSRYPDRFQIEQIEDCELIGDKLLLQMAINNIIENAIKYTPADMPISIGLASKNNLGILRIADNGPGIPDTEKRKIFNKFYRIGSEETRKTKGTGLGLYLTSKIVKQHKGKIVVKDNQPAGAVFEISLPLTSQT